MQELRKAGKRAAKAEFQKWIDATIDDPRAASFVLETFDLSYEFIAETVSSGGVPKKADVARFLVSKGVTFSTLSQDNMVACVASVTALGVTASSATAAASGGPVGLTLYVGMMMLDALDVGGNCYLAYLDREAEAQISQFRNQLDARRMRVHAEAVCSIARKDSLADGISAILSARASRPPQKQSLQ